MIKRLLSSDATAGMGAERMAADVRADNIYSASSTGWCHHVGGDVGAGISAG
ncbi:hypothetical protein [Escherichia coli]|uniref:hypothetical protein n=1 Tax=Escherichia coli TaxID=562 RepID=UPI002FCD6527